MPTIYRERGFRFHFFSNERQEPPHVHVQQGDGEAKFWLADATLAYSVGFTGPQLRVAREIVAVHREQMLEAWHDYHRTSQAGRG